MTKPGRRRGLRVIRGLAEVQGPAGNETVHRDADDLVLIRRIAEQDREAFEILYRRFYPRLFRFLRRRLHRDEIVCEILNDVMLVVWQKARAFEGRSKPSTWILGIAHKKAMKALARIVRTPSSAAPELAEALEDPRSAEEMSRRELIMVLRGAFEELSAEQRVVVELTCHYGYSYKEIARMTGVPVNTVKTRMFYARRRLREVWPGQENQP